MTNPKKAEFQNKFVECTNKFNSLSDSMRELQEMAKEITGEEYEAILDEFGILLMKVEDGSCVSMTEIIKNH